ncbi:MAG: histidine kinase [Cytophagales bacterium]|nr:histidine kinase [Cytophagales bacterium]
MKQLRITTSTRSILWLLLSTCFIHHHYAQSPYLRNINTKQGLPHNIVYSIVQDSLGYIWMGTEAGLCRFDGTHFKTYQMPSERAITADELIYDGDKRIYFKNFSDQLFFVENDTIHEIPTPEGSGTLLNLRALSPDEIIVHLDSTYLYNPTNKSWKNLYKGAKYMALDVNKKAAYTFTNSNKKLTGRLMRYSFQSDSVEYFSSITKRSDLIEVAGEDLINFDYAHYKAYRWNNEKGEHRWNLIFPELKHLVQSPINQISKDKQGKYWISTISGVVSYSDPKTPYESGLKYLNGKFVSDFLQDAEGNFWFTTIGNGVFVMYQDNALVYTKENSWLNYDQVKRISILPDDELFLATNGQSAYRIDQTGSRLFAYDTPEADTECIYFDEKQGRLYLESYQYHYKNPIPITKYNGGTTPKNITAFNDDLLATAAGNGGFLVKKPHRTQSPWPKEYLPGPSNKFEIGFYPNLLKLRGTRCRDVHFDKVHQTIWYGFADGLFGYQSGQEILLTLPNGDPIIALDLEAASDGSFWAATVKTGIVQIKNGNVIDQLTSDHGLSSNYVNVLKIKDGLFYLGTDKGLQVLDPKTGLSRFFDEQDGLPTNAIADLGITSDKVWIATLNGLVSLPLDFDGMNTYAPKVYLNSVSVNGEKLVDSSNRFAYFENDLLFRFTGISIRSEGKFQYQYRLLGLSDEWTQADGSIQEKRYVSLPPGEYNFQIKAINEDGIESESIREYPFIITKPFWQTWWFITLVVLVIAFAISTIFTFRIRRIQQRNELERAMNSSKLDALKLQMNPHFLFNSLTAIQEYILKEKSDVSSHYVGLFSTLMREILNNSRREYVSIQEEVDMLKKYLQLQQVRFEQPIHYEIIVDQNLAPQYESIPPMFTQPFIENSIEHGLFKKPENEIRILFSKKSDSLLELAIVDNGIGIVDQSEKSNHHSLASTIVRERLDLLQKTTPEKIEFSMQNIYGSDSKIMGFKVNFTLPIKVILYG